MRIRRSGSTQAQQQQGSGSKAAHLRSAVLVGAADAAGRAEPVGTARSRISLLARKGLPSPHSSSARLSFAACPDLESVRVREEVAVERERRATRESGPRKG